MKSISDAQYRSIGQLRHQIRLFLRQGEAAAREHGIGGQQYQVLLAIRSIQTGGPCTIRALSDHLLLKHHSTVELVDRLEANRLIVRSRDSEDRRQVFVKLQPKAERILDAILRKRLGDLRGQGRKLVRTLHRLVEATHQKRPRAKTDSFSPTTFRPQPTKYPAHRRRLSLPIKTTRTFWGNASPEK